MGNQTRFVPKPSAERIKLSDPNLILPLEKLLLIINDPHKHHEDYIEAITLALPYCHRPKSAEPPAMFDFSRLRTATQMLAAQRKIMQSVGEGRTDAALGRQLIESIAIMIRCLDTTILEDRLEEVERNAQSGKPVLMVVNAVDDDPPEGVLAMARAKLRRLRHATTVAGEQSFQVHNWIGDLPRAEDDASFGRVPALGTNSAEASKVEVAARPWPSPRAHEGNPLMVG